MSIGRILGCLHCGAACYDWGDGRLWPVDPVDYAGPHRCDRDTLHWRQLDRRLGEIAAALASQAPPRPRPPAPRGPATRLPPPREDDILRGVVPV